jgi:hypothetical protein
MHLGMSMFGDDINFSKKLLSIENMKQRYFKWSSRIIIDSFLIGLLHYPPYPFLLWKILNIVMICCCAMGLKYLFWKDGNTLINNLVIVLLCMLYPIQEMSSAGWAATFVNYFWPITLCILSFVIDKRILNENYPNKKLQVFSVVTLLIGTDAEVAWVFSVFMTVVAYMLNYKKERLRWYYVAKFSILLISFIKIIMCPGNHLRFLSEVGSWFPDFYTLSIFDKIYLGSVTTASYMLNRSNLIFGFIVVISSFIVLSMRKQYLLKLYFSFILLLKFLGMNVRNQNNIWSLFHAGERITIMNSTNIMNYVCFACSALILISIAVLILSQFGVSKKSLYLNMWYFAGLSARMVLIFSPTLYASSLRTFLLLDISLIGIAIELCKYVYVNKLKDIHCFTE